VSSAAILTSRIIRTGGAALRIEHFGKRGQVRLVTDVPRLQPRQPCIGALRFLPLVRDAAAASAARDVSKSISEAPHVLSCEALLVGRTAERVRSEIRIRFGFREATVADADALSEWLRDHAAAEAGGEIETMVE
jgi:hypothetical protein